jgi:DNA-binding transcriptional LysR family regulator
MIQSGLGVSYGPRECVDEAVFDDIACVTLPGAPSWDLGIVTRDEALRGAAGRSFLAAYRQQCQKALAGMSPHPDQHERAGEPDAPPL